MDYPLPMNDNNSGRVEEGGSNGPGNPSIDILRRRRQHNTCQSSVLNLGCNPRLGVLAAPDKCTGGGVTQECAPWPQLPRTRLSRNNVPSQERVLVVLLTCLPVDCRPKLDSFVFRECVKEVLGPRARPGEPMLCATPVRWIWGGLQEVFLDLPVAVGTGSRFDISVATQYTLLLVLSNTTVVQWPGTVFRYTGRLVIQ